MKCPHCQSDNPDTTNFCGKCETRLGLPGDGLPSAARTLGAPIRRLKTGSLFAERYEILEELGQSGMGEVYRHRKPDEEMALKA
jgi:hypothetical protein